MDPPVTVVEPCAAVLDVNVLHHFEAAAHWWCVCEDDDGPLCVLLQHRLKPGHLVVINVHLMHTARDSNDRRDSCVLTHSADG